jgi:[ribosomal protein S5]-alanine N-acetyltransferase
MPTLIAPVMDSGMFSQAGQPSIAVGSVATLRPWESTDAEAVAHAFADPEIQRWHVRRADSVGEARQWIDEWRAGWADGTELNWALADRASNALMGRMSLKGVDLRNGSAGLSYWMVPASRRRGLCVQASITLCQWAFTVGGFHRIGLAHSVVNVASCRVAVKAGFREEGVRRRGALHADGWHDMHTHSLLAEDKPQHE